ncbi:hypothetical protein DM860_016629 [Cuscuta australis]|uniref:Uncharacterized protein n=1 Tax=Cuscuta australis TaxID=267555 RepID=A0A328DL29_9ASTE|nr:hypothetical protein DM860_016629 [Cuscuta australis]
MMKMVSRRRRWMVIVVKLLPKMCALLIFLLLHGVVVAPPASLLFGDIYVDVDCLDKCFPGGGDCTDGGGNYLECVIAKLDACSGSCGGRSSAGGSSSPPVMAPAR